MVSTLTAMKRTQIDMVSKDKSVTGQSHESLASFREVALGTNRKFGLTIGLILIALAVFPRLLQHHPMHLWLVALGVAALVLGLAAPGVLGPINRLWFRLGLLLGRITNPVVMGILFFVVLVPMAFYVRLRGQDLLRLRRDAKAKSYWINRDPTTTRTSLTKQF